MRRARGREGGKELEGERPVKVVGACHVQERIMILLPGV
jgi:hypothetical protein